MKLVGLVLAAIIGALLVYAVACPATLPGILIARAWRGVESLLGAPAASTDPETLELAPAQTVTGRSIPWTEPAARRKGE